MPVRAVLRTLYAPGAKRVMHIGILRCDTVRDEFRPRFGDYPDMFQELLDRVASGIRYTAYDVSRGEYPETTGTCDAYLLTGSRHGVYDDLPWIAPLAEYVRTLHRERRRMVGVCFGHQLISAALGGRAEKSQRGWGVGVATVKIASRPAWMRPPRDEYSLIVSHQDQVTQLPPGGECIAGSEFCPYAALTVDDNVLSFQGHPEFSPELSLALMEWRRDIVGAERTAAGVASLGQPLQATDVAAWMVSFLRGSE